MEEAHGILKSDRFVVGNGVLVGLEVGGKPRVAFVTCRHVITDRMIATGRSFLDRAADENYLYFNKRGWGFWYKGFNNIDSKRWNLSPYADQDFAWIVLTEDELSSFANGSPSYCRMPRDLFDEDSDILKASDFRTRGFSIGSPVELMHMFSPVTGEGEPCEKFYWQTYIKVPSSAYMLANVYSESGSLIKGQSPIRVDNVDAGGHSSNVLDVMTMDIRAHVNISGSPVFTNLGGKRYLIGLQVAYSADGSSAFQSLDRILPHIRDSLLR